MSSHICPQGAQRQFDLCLPKPHNKKTCLNYITNKGTKVHAIVPIKVNWTIPGTIIQHLEDFNKEHDNLFNEFLKAKSKGTLTSFFNSISSTSLVNSLLHYSYLDPSNNYSAIKEAIISIEKGDHIGALFTLPQFVNLHKSNYYLTEIITLKKATYLPLSRHTHYKDFLYLILDPKTILKVETKHTLKITHTIWNVKQVNLFNSNISSTCPEYISNTVPTSGSTEISYKHLQKQILSESKGAKEELHYKKITGLPTRTNYTLYKQFWENTAFLLLNGEFMLLNDTKGYKKIGVCRIDKIIKTKKSYRFIGYRFVTKKDTRAWFIHYPQKRICENLKKRIDGSL